MRRGEWDQANDDKSLLSGKGSGGQTKKTRHTSEIKSMATDATCEEEEADLQAALRSVAREVGGYPGCRLEEAEEIYRL